MRLTWDFEKLGRLKDTVLISVDLAEVFVKLLELALGEVKVFELSLLLCQLVSHLLSAKLNQLYKH